MENIENILKYAGYSAYIVLHALAERDGRTVGNPDSPLFGPLSSNYCRWLIREFNIHWEQMPKKWCRLFSSLNKRLHVKVEEFSLVPWDDKKVLSYYMELSENRRLMAALRKGIHDYNMNLEDVASKFGMNARQMDDLLRRSVWASEDILKAVEKSLPLDEGFPGRFQINTEEITK